MNRPHVTSCTANDGVGRCGCRARPPPPRRPPPRASARGGGGAPTSHNRTTPVAPISHDVREPAPARRPRDRHAVLDFADAENARAERELAHSRCPRVRNRCGRRAVFVAVVVRELDQQQLEPVADDRDARGCARRSFSSTTRHGLSHARPPSVEVERALGRRRGALRARIRARRAARASRRGPTRGTRRARAPRAERCAAASAPAGAPSRATSATSTTRH